MDNAIFIAGFGIFALVYIPVLRAAEAEVFGFLPAEGFSRAEGKFRVLLIASITFIIMIG